MLDRWPHIAGRIEEGVHVLPVRVYYEDTDFSGFVYHANYLKFCERGRSDLLRLIGIHHRRLSESEGGGGFVVSVLRQDQIHLAEVFGTSSGRDQDKLAGVPWLPAPSGAPILAQALAWLDCRLHDRFRVGDHEIILGRPVGGKLVEPGAPPLLYPDTGDLDGSRGLYPDSLG